MNLDYFFAMPHVYLKTLIALHLIFRVLRNLKRLLKRFRERCRVGRQVLVYIILICKLSLFYMKKGEELTLFYMFSLQLSWYVCCRMQLSCGTYMASHYIWLRYILEFVFFILHVPICACILIILLYQLMAEERWLRVDVEGFNNTMDEAKERSRNAQDKVLHSSFVNSLLIYYYYSDELFGLRPSQ